MKGFCYKGSSKYLYVKPLTTTYSPFFLFTFLLQQEIILPSLANGSVKKKKSVIQYNLDGNL